MKSKDMVRAENSLRDYILEEIGGDDAQTQKINLYKYKGLSLTVTWESKKEPFFNVQIMAFEASFNIETGMKIQGGLTDFDTSLIQKWAKQSAIRGLLARIWANEARETKEVKLKPFDMM